MAPMTARARNRIGLTALVALATACGPAPSVTPSPTPEASGGPTPPPVSGTIEVSAVVQVVADELRLRAEPSTGASLVAAMPRGHLVRVESGPVEAEGYRWWELVEVGGTTGWAADGDGTDAWLAGPLAAEAPPLLRLDQVCDVTFPPLPPATTILTDGTVLLTVGDVGPGDPGPQPWRIGTLAPAGLEHIQANVLGSPYLRASAEYLAEPLPGAEPPGHGGCVHEFTVGGGEIVVSAVGWFGGEEEEAFWQPSPERKTLTEIAENLVALDDVLDDALWSVPPTVPYLAGTYTLVVAADPIQAPLANDVPQLEADPLRELLAESAETELGRCTEVSTREAFELAMGLGAAAPPFLLQGMSSTSFVAEETLYALTAVPQTPVGEPSCADIGG